MKVYSEINLRDFNAWSGAIQTKNKILETEKDEEFEEYINECFPNGIDETMLNDILWFDNETIFEMFGIDFEE